MRVYRKKASVKGIATEAASLQWLAQAGGAPVVELVEVGDTWLTTRFIDGATPTHEAAAEFGRQLAVTHAAGADWWGQAPPGLRPKDLVLAELPTPAPAKPKWSSFGEYYADGRLLPYLKQARGLEKRDLRLLNKAIDAVATGKFDSPQPRLCPQVARLHGDLWTGNVMWEGGRIGTMIDPCANGGHAETDLADLGLFGAPHFADIVAGYNEVSPLADGWEERVPLHRFRMILVHVVLLGGGYVNQALDIARGLT